MVHIQYSLNVESILVCSLVTVAGKSYREYISAFVNASKDDIGITYINGKYHMITSLKTVCFSLS